MSQSDQALRRTKPGFADPSQAGSTQNSTEEDAGHFRAQGRKGVSMPGALRIAVVADTETEVNWSRDVRIVDLGLGGACVESADSVAAGTVVELLIDAPNLWEPMTLNGAVAWERRNGKQVRIGVCFDHGSGASVRALTELLEAAAFA